MERGASAPYLLGFKQTQLVLRAPLSSPVHGGFGGEADGGGITPSNKPAKPQSMEHLLLALDRWTTNPA